MQEKGPSGAPNITDITYLVQSENSDANLLDLCAGLPPKKKFDDSDD